MVTSNGSLKEKFLALFRLYNFVRTSKVTRDELASVLTVSIQSADFTIILLYYSREIKNKPPKVKAVVRVRRLDIIRRALKQ